MDLITSDTPGKLWFALYTRPRQEFKAAECMERNNILHYLPTIKRLSQWSDRKKLITEPLLRGYIFILADERERLNALKEYPVLNCVFDKGKPAVIPKWQMENLYNFLKKESEFYLYEGLIPGNKVKINSGPFSGIIGIIQQSDSTNTLAVTIELLNRSILAHISHDTKFELVKE
ncbi:MAG: UpxY family transcription antiterminator [Ignavibacteriales bacterium]|nr:MAG: UpxY family transcription antiterminator [Ignavibacteriales bacterium]